MRCRRSTTNVRHVPTRLLHVKIRWSRPFRTSLARYCRGHSFPSAMLLRECILQLNYCAVSVARCYIRAWAGAIEPPNLHRSNHFAGGFITAVSQAGSPSSSGLSDGISNLYQRGHRHRGHTSANAVHRPHVSGEMPDVVSIFPQLLRR